MPVCHASRDCRGSRGASRWSAPRHAAGNKALPAGRVRLFLDLIHACRTNLRSGDGSSPWAKLTDDARRREVAELLPITMLPNALARVFTRSAVVRLKPPISRPDLSPFTQALPHMGSRAEAASFGVVLPESAQLSGGTVSCSRSIQNRPCKMVKGSESSELSLPLFPRVLIPFFPRRTNHIESSSFVIGSLPPCSHSLAALGRLCSCIRGAGSRPCAPENLRCVR